MTYEDIILNSVFQEMKQANVNVCYSELLIDRHLRRNRIYNFAISIFSVIGATLGFVSLIFPTIVCVLTGAAEIIKTIVPCLIINSDDISKLSALSVEYDSYFFKLKKIHDDLFAGIINAKTAGKDLSSLIIANSKNRNEISKLFGEISDKLHKRAIDSSDNYLKSIYPKEE